jgi:glycosyltransferase involved in cell wall biosynthesis
LNTNSTTLLAAQVRQAAAKTVPKMRLVLITHPLTFGIASIPRFTEMIQRGMKSRGCHVETWTSAQQLGRFRVASPSIRKWLGYADQYLIYPRMLKKLVDRQPANTLFVVTDQALGMWIPALSHRPHVIHCHDFLALRSSLGEFPENPTGWTGRQYQRLIQRGFSRGKVFISVSRKTQDDLHRFLPRTPRISEVVYNGLNFPFRPMPLAKRMSLLVKTGMDVPGKGFILHISGNQWYKNPKGVLEIYRAYAAASKDPCPLWMAGAKPDDDLTALGAAIPLPGKVQFISGLNNEQVNAAYSHARALLFPSVAEGFGWPVVEAMASGCPVITTDVAPMTEIAGGVARFIPPMPREATHQNHWAKSAARSLEELVLLMGDERAELLRDGLSNAARFNAETALDAYETIYSRALESWQP